LNFIQDERQKTVDILNRIQNLTFSQSMLELTKDEHSYMI
jgi:hypothetical protein